MNFPSSTEAHTCTCTCENTFTNKMLEEKLKLDPSCNAASNALKQNFEEHITDINLPSPIPGMNIQYKVPFVSI